MKRKLEEDKEGVAGFFLDLPVLVLVIVVIMAFIGSLYRLSPIIGDEDEGLQQSQICLRVKEKVQNYPKLLKEGDFSIKKLNALDNKTLKSYLDLSSEYAYHLYFEKLENGKRWIFGREVSEAGPGVDMDSYKIPIDLVDSEGHSHLGKLEVMVWKD